MRKKKFFISHAAEEAPVAEQLRTCAQDSFGGRCEGFVSTVYESLPPGKEWLTEIKAVLHESMLFFCLVGPRSKNRPWLYFESGAAWLKGIPVVPLVHSGLEPEDLGLPLDSRQALRVQTDRFLENFHRCIADTLKLGAVPRNLKWDEMRSNIDAAFDEVRGPREVVWLWNQALTAGDVGMAERLTSVSAHDFINATWGSLQALSTKYKAGSGFKSVFEGERIDVDADAAFVDYRTYYRNESSSVMRWSDLVIRESGEWKVAPQFAVWEDMTPESRLCKPKARPTRRSTRTRQKAARR